MDIRFDCTQCGKCCHDLRLPLSVDEAIGWAGQGHQVQLLCDALPDLAPTDLGTSFRFERSFRARSGNLAIRVNVLLVATHAGPCPHLGPDMRCSNYAARPRVCRIYPAEIAPHVRLAPETKACPPEAWADEQPILTRSGIPVSRETRELIDAHRDATLKDVAVKASVCAMLRITTAALGNEGYAVHAIRPDDLVSALAGARPAMSDVALQSWTIVTNRSSTLAMLTDAGADGIVRSVGTDYIGFFPDEHPMPA